MLNFLSTVMPIICGLCIAMFLVLLIVLIIFFVKKKNIKRIVLAIIICSICTVAMFIGTIMVLKAYGKAAYEQSEDYKKWEDTIDRMEEISERSEESMDWLKSLE